MLQLKKISHAKEDASERKLDACKFAAATEFINELPNKYETMIGENGVRLSEVKTKNFNSKGYIKRSQIILLDEATSSLDANWKLFKMLL